MENLVIIQARMGSTRLPGKVLLDLEGKPVLEHVVNRVLKADIVEKVIVATSIDEKNLPLIKTCAERGISVFTGSEDDVLDRFYQAAKLFSPNHVIRITADCPLIDPAVIDMVVKKHILEKADYTTNTFEETFPDGEDVEVFTFTALERAWKEAGLLSEREHVTPFIRKKENGFSHCSITRDPSLGDKRWTLDNEEDFLFIKTVYSHLYKRDPLFSMEDIVSFLAENKGIEELNKHISRNEGYQKSLMNDKASGV